MTYVALIYQGTTPLPGTPEWDELSHEEQERVYADYAALNSTAGVTPGHPLGLPDRSTTVRVVDGEPTTTPAPYAGAQGAIGGYFVLEADDEEAAVAMAARVPAARLGGAVELRRVETYW